MISSNPEQFASLGVSLPPWPTRPHNSLGSLGITMGPIWSSTPWLSTKYTPFVLAAPLARASLDLPVVTCSLAEKVMSIASLLNPLVLRDLDPNMFPENFARFSPLSFQSDNYVLADYDISVGCKLGDDRWDIIGPGYECQYRSYYFQGLLFRLEICTWVTTIMDTSSCKELYVIQPPKYEKVSKMSFRGPYLVESCGDILIVCYNQSYEWIDYKFYIHRLEFGNGKGNPCWIKLSSIGDRILFFDFSLGFGRGFGRGFCLIVSDFPKFKGNCIYFINRVHFCQYVINMYDIENGETVLIYTPFNRENPIAWFIPTLNHI